MIALLLFLLVTTVAVWVFMQKPEFGTLPSGERLERIKKSPHFREGRFHNLTATPDLTEGVTYLGVMKDFLFSEKLRNKPVDTIPSEKSSLSNIDGNENVLVWFGHSSYFMQIDGKRFLVDPVMSGTASPLSFTTRSFPGTDIYEAAEIPAIDYLLITHDHWDHLDYETLIALKDRIGMVICGLGTGAHLETWGFPEAKIIEKDWNESILLPDGFTVYAESARHFSGRGFSRNMSLWMSYVLETPSVRIYVGGDSGYDSHFRSVRERFFGFDLVILENGQYDKSWKYIHMMPEEVIQAAKDLNAKKLFAVHSSKFALGNHAWDEPMVRISELSSDAGVDLITPMIGQKVYLDDRPQEFSRWWVGID